MDESKMELDLQGKIENFNLTEILQLIASGKNSGTLGIQKDDSIVMIYFKDGEIIYGYGPRQTFHLGQLLKDKGIISSAQLEETVDIQAKTENSRRLGDILISRGYVDRTDLETVVKQQIEDILFSLLAWESGTFKFYQDQYPTDEEITVSISVENLIMEGLKKVDEMKLVKETIPNRSLMLKISSTSNNRKRTVSFDSDDWNMMALVNGQRTINQICNLSSLTTERSSVILAKLKLAGIVEVTKGAGEAESKELNILVENLAGLFEEYLTESSLASGKNSRLTTSVLENIMENKD